MKKFIFTMKTSLKRTCDLVFKAVQVETIVINQYFERIWRSMTWNIFLTVVEF
jgi:hypothetical protein